MAVVLGDQLDHDSPALGELDSASDAVVMMEVDAEAHAGPSHRQRTALFFSAMRHFAGELADAGHRVRYTTADDDANTHTLGGEVARAADALRPERIVLVRPGEWRVYEDALSWGERTGAELAILEDDRFTCTLEDFNAWAKGRRSLTMEYFYRERRRALGVLVDDAGQPEGGAWNYDHDNRQTFGRDGPSAPPPLRFEPDAITRDVIDLVARRYPDAPGRLERFSWPVTRAQAHEALDDFIAHRLAGFGPYEDAMWTDEPWLFHSQLSVPLNLGLLRPMPCVRAALHAYDRGAAPLNSVEGFVRQLIGWREFIRGVYWREGPRYRDRNFLDQDGALPAFYWDGDTDMRCLADALGPVLDHAYAHHIPRLMVLGNLALTAGVAPRAIGDWFYGMFADSVDWATTPNTIGMSQYADGDADTPPVVATKPYAASANYIKKMGNHCRRCPYDPKLRHGEGPRGRACPFNTFYWDFLLRHERRFAGDNRMAMIMRHLERMGNEERVAITTSASRLRATMGIDAQKQASGRQAQ